MKIIVDDDIASLSVLKLQHNKEEAIWDASTYDRTTTGDVNDIFREINDYWATLSEQRQQGIWDTYQKIQDIFESVFDTQKLHSKLVALSKELLDQHPLDEIKYWVEVKSDLRVPSSMKIAYDHDDSRDRTYLKADYEGLVHLAIAIRPMVPVWGEYIRRIKDESGTNYKEYVALGLIARANIAASAPMNRLRKYLEASVGPETITMSSVLGGLGSAELPDWLLGISLVRKVALVDIGGSDEKNNIMSNVYRIVRNNIETLNRKFKGTVIEKRRTKESVDDDNSSGAENYKVKQELPDGDLVTLSIYTEKVLDMALKVDPGIDLEKVNLCVRAITPHAQLEIMQHHLTLTQWCLKPALSPRAIPSLTKPALLRAMAATQAILWHWGFIELAFICAAKVAPSRNESMLGISESRARIPKELVARLVELYPYYQDIGGKQATLKQQNPACKAVELIAKEMSRSDWEVIAPTELVKVGPSLIGGKRLILPPDIKAQLAGLAIHIAEREIAKTRQNNEAMVGV